MKQKILPLLFILNYCLLLYIPCFAWTDWKTLKTKQFTIFYNPKQKTQAFDLLLALENNRPKVETLVGNSYEKLSIVLEDIGTLSNGLTDPIFKRIIIFKYSPSNGELNFNENWFSLVGTHEYTHMLHITKTGGFPQVLSSIFGNVFCPNLFSPGWYIEGITVYSESILSKYSGRLNDGMFDSYIAARVKENKFPSIVEATNSPLSFPYGTGIYLYGGEFFRYLANRYGEKRFSYLFDDYGSSMLSYFSPYIPYISFDLSCEDTYEKSFPSLWKDWKKYEMEKHKDFAIDGERLTFYGGYIDNLIIYNNKIYYRKNSIIKTGPYKYFTFNDIIERNIMSGQERVLVSIPYIYTAPFKIKEDNLYYSVAELRRGYANVNYLGYGIYSNLYRKNIKSGNVSKIVKSSLRAFDPIDSNTIIYSEDSSDDSGSDLYKYYLDTNKKEKILSSDYFVNEILYKNNDNVFVSAKKNWENSNVYKLDLSSSEFLPIGKTPFWQGSINIYENKLFYSANYNGKYSIYCYDTEKIKNYKLTNDNGYANYPSYDETSNKLYFIGLTSDGFDIFTKQAEFKEFDAPQYTPSRWPELKKQSLNLLEGGYLANLTTIIPKVWFPIGKSDYDESYFGALFMGQTALGDFLYSFSAIYDTKNNKPDASGNFTSYFFSPGIIYLNYDSIDEKIAELGLRYLLLQRLSPGISTIIPSLAYKRFSQFRRYEIRPSLAIGWNYPKTRLNFNITLPFEPDKTYTIKQRQAIYFNSSLQQYLKNSEMDINVLFVDDNLNPETKDIFPIIRGYTKEPDANKGIHYSIDFSIPLLKIRWGLWNPNIYFEDICGAVFIEGINTENNKDQRSFGCELHLETKAMFGTNSDLGTRWTINKENVQTIEVFFKMYI